MKNLIAGSIIYGVFCLSLGLMYRNHIKHDEEAYQNYLDSITPSKSTDEEK